MLTFEQGHRLARLQLHVIHWTREALKKDGLHKSSEGYVEIGYCLPGMFMDEQSPYYQLQVYSYVLGPNRMHMWTDATIDGVLARGEAAVHQWTKALQHDAFERDMEKLMGADTCASEQIPPHPAFAEKTDNETPF